MAISNKHQWFDGWVYSSFIAPNLKFIFKKVYDIINKQSTVLDVACGTGFFALNYYANFLKIVGVDLSSTNIKKAQQLKQKKNIKNIEFIHQDAAKLSENFPKNAFNYSFISLALHEMPENIRITVIKQMSEVSK